MSEPFVYRRRVEFADTDMAGIIHFTALFRYMEEAEHAFRRSVGAPVMDVTETGRISWPRVSAKCDYLSPTKYDDELSIEVRVVRLGAKSATFGFAVNLGVRAVARGEIVTVCCQLPAASAKEHSLEAIPIPEALRAKLSG